MGFEFELYGEKIIFSDKQINFIKLCGEYKVEAQEWVNELYIDYFNDMKWDEFYTSGWKKLDTEIRWKVDMIVLDINEINNNHVTTESIIKQFYNTIFSEWDSLGKELSERYSNAYRDYTNKIGVSYGLEYLTGDFKSRVATVGYNYIAGLAYIFPEYDKEKYEVVSNDYKVSTKILSKVASMTEEERKKAFASIFQIAPLMEKAYLSAFRYIDSDYELILDFAEAVGTKLMISSIVFPRFLENTSWEMMNDSEKKLKKDDKIKLLKKFDSLRKGLNYKEKPGSGEKQMMSWLSEYNVSEANKILNMADISKGPFEEILKYKARLEELNEFPQGSINKVMGVFMICFKEREEEERTFLKLKFANREEAQAAREFYSEFEKELEDAGDSREKLDELKKKLETLEDWKQSFKNRMLDAISTRVLDMDITECIINNYPCINLDPQTEEEISALRVVYEDISEKFGTDNPSERYKEIYEALSTKEKKLVDQKKLEAQNIVSEKMSEMSYDNLLESKKKLEELNRVPKNCIEEYLNTFMNHFNEIEKAEKTFLNQTYSSVEEARIAQNRYTELKAEVDNVSNSKEDLIAIKNKLCESDADDPVVLAINHVIDDEIKKIEMTEYIANNASDINLQSYSLENIASLEKIYNDFVGKYSDKNLPDKIRIIKDKINEGKRYASIASKQLHDIEGEVKKARQRNIVLPIICILFIAICFFCVSNWFFKILFILILAVVAIKTHKNIENLRKILEAENREIEEARRRISR